MKKAGSCRELNPGHLWLEPPVLCHWAMTAGQPPTLTILFSPHSIQIHLFPAWGKMLSAIMETAMVFWNEKCNVFHVTLYHLCDASYINFVIRIETGYEWDWPKMVIPNCVTGRVWNRGCSRGCPVNAVNSATALRLLLRLPIRSTTLACECQDNFWEGYTYYHRENKTVYREKKR